MIGYLPNIELRLYSVFYFLLIVILLYNVQSISNCKYKQFLITNETYRTFLPANLPDYNFMGNGWSLLNRKIDDYDLEWTTWKNLVMNYWFCFVIHSISAEVFRYLKLEVSII